MSAAVPAADVPSHAASLGPQPPSPWLAFWHQYRSNRGAVVALAVFALIALAALFAPWVAPNEPLLQHRQHLLTPPLWQLAGSVQFPLGTDELGRCLLSRLLHGARVSLLIGLASVALALVPGMLLGLVAAFYPRVAGAVLMRLVDLLLALPGLLLAICVVAILGPGLLNTSLAIAVGALPGYIRLMRGAALTQLPREYVLASRLAGASNWRLMFTAVLPNAVAPLIVAGTLAFSSAILEAAALGFLGLGVQPPTPEWGSMLSSARDYIERAPWVVTLPGLAILITVLSVNLVGDGLRDALDPKLRQAA